MKLWLTIFNLALVCNLLMPLSIYAAPAQTAETKNSKRNFQFKFVNKSLVDAINAVAAAKEINIVLPSGADAITNKVTIMLEEKMTIDEAWNLLLTILDTAGYSMIPSGENTSMYRIRKTTPDVVRDTFPFYVNVPYTQLPSSVERIGFLYYLANIKLSDPASESELKQVLEGLLPAQAKVIFNKESNGILMTAPSDSIKSVMEIISTLDKADFQEVLEIITLRHSAADIVANLFNAEILQNTAQPINRLNTEKKSPDSSYFSQNIRLIPIPRTNSIMMIGRRQAIDRVKDFIFKYIDVELESGKSILHIYELQYLSAKDLVPVLNNIVSSASKGSGQSKSEAQSNTERMFEGVIIKDDSVLSAQDNAKSAYGGNRLVVAARNKDWKRISKIIEELDTPQQQVIIEVLIADVTIVDSRILNALTRNINAIPLPEQVDIQAAHAAHVIGNDGQNPTTIKSDVLRLAFDSNGNYVTTAGGGAESLTSLLTPGSTVLSLSDSDGKTYSVLQLLQQFKNSKIISHPHVIATNNHPAVVTVTEQRLVDDAASASANTTTVTRKYLEAPLKVTVTPRINSDASVNLSVMITIGEFIGTTGADRISRTVETNVNIKDRDVLALGGLVRTVSNKSRTETPLLSKIPILGNFFKKSAGDDTQVSLMVFISPTIISPRVRGGIGSYTEDYINISKQFAQDGGLFDALRDPVTRWYFKAGINADTELDKFVETDEFKTGKTEKLSNGQLRPEALYAKPAPQETPEATEENPLLSTSLLPELASNAVMKKDDDELARLLKDTDNPLAT